MANVHVQRPVPGRWLHLHLHFIRVIQNLDLGFVSGFTCSFRKHPLGALKFWKTLTRNKPFFQNCVLPFFFIVSGLLVALSQAVAMASARQNAPRSKQSPIHPKTDSPQTIKRKRDEAKQPRHARRAARHKNNNRFVLWFFEFLGHCYWPLFVNLLERDLLTCTHILLTLFWSVYRRIFCRLLLLTNKVVRTWFVNKCVRSLFRHYIEPFLLALLCVVYRAILRRFFCVLERCL